MIFELDSESIAFPPVSYAEDDGLIAVGGDLSPNRILEAYRNGIFPWFTEDSEYMWWSPNPRLILKPTSVKISKSMRKILRENIFEIKLDCDFVGVMHGCALSKRDGQSGTWITNEMIDAYTSLHEMGFAHSVEAYQNNQLVGGLYGLAIGKVFFGESMFHLVNNASKVSFISLCQYLVKHDFHLIDAQQDTPHLRSLGAEAVTRDMFIEIIKVSANLPAVAGKWYKSHNTLK